MSNFTFRHTSNGAEIADGIDTIRIRSRADGSKEIAVHTDGEEFSEIEAALIDVVDPAPDPEPDPEPTPDPVDADVSNMAELMAWLSVAAPRGTITLAPGNYGDLSLRGTEAVTLRSADFSRPATFSSATLIGVRSLTFDGIRFEGQNYAGGELSGDGVSLRGCVSVSIERSEVRGFNQGIKLLECTGVWVSNTDIHTIAGDGIKVAKVKGLWVEDCHLHDFRANPGSAKHRDMIQIFTKGHEYASSAVTIRGCRFDIGDGDWTQSIYARNEEVDQGRNPDMFYEDFVIEGNVVRNAQIHGISIGETHGLTIRDNTVEYVPAPTGPGRPDVPNAPIPRISVAEKSTGVSITGNTAPGYRGDIQQGWTVEGNVWTD